MGLDLPAGTIGTGGGTGIVGLRPRLFIVVPIFGVSGGVIGGVTPLGISIAGLSGWISSSIFILA
jgi:hypothetical protein